MSPPQMVINYSWTDTDLFC